MQQPKIHIIHEHQEWTNPLLDQLNQLGAPYENWFINEGKINLNETPPEGIFYNRMSASSHTRDHRYAIELSESIISWLEAHGRTVLNGKDAIHLEVRKTEQLIALATHGINAPKSIITNNHPDLLKAARELNETPFIVKPNRGGKGLGVKLYRSLEQLENDIARSATPQSLDGILIVQQYVKPFNDRITRVEIIDGKFYYAVSVDASGGFELCPADVCQVDDAFCPVGEEPVQSDKNRFEIIENYQNDDLNKYVQLFRSKGIAIGALEYVTDARGNRYVYDINTNTNYNSTAELQAGNNVSGMGAIARFLSSKLKE